MFRSATAFNQPLGSWNVANIVDIRSMFRSAAAFNQDLSSWDVGGKFRISTYVHHALLYARTLHAARRHDFQNL